MLRVEQIKLLESRVNKAIEIISKLREENKTLRAGLLSAQKKIDELEDLVNSFKSEQEEIEAGIIRALNSLDKLEDEIKEEREDTTITSQEKEEKTEKQPPTIQREVKRDTDIQEKIPKERSSSEPTGNSQLDIF